MTHAIIHRISTIYLPEFRAWVPWRGQHRKGNSGRDAGPFKRVYRKGRRPQQDEAPTRLRLPGRRTF